MEVKNIDKERNLKMKKEYDNEDDKDERTPNANRSDDLKRIVMQEVDENGNEVDDSIERNVNGNHVNGDKDNNEYSDKGDDEKDDGNKGEDMDNEEFSQEKEKKKDKDKENKFYRENLISLMKYYHFKIEDIKGLVSANTNQNENHTAHNSNKLALKENYNEKTKNLQLYSQLQESLLKKIQEDENLAINLQSFLENYDELEEQKHYNNNENNEESNKNPLLSLNSQSGYDEYNEKNENEKPKDKIKTSKAEKIITLLKKIDVILNSNQKEYKNLRENLTNIISKLLINQNSVFTPNEFLLSTTDSNNNNNNNKVNNNLAFLKKKRREIIEDNERFEEEENEAKENNQDYLNKENFKILDNYDYFENCFFNSNLDLDEISKNDKKKISNNPYFKIKTLHFYEILKDDIFSGFFNYNGNNNNNNNSFKSNVYGNRNFYNSTGKENSLYYHNTSSYSNFGNNINISSSGNNNHHQKEIGNSGNENNNNNNNNLNSQPKKIGLSKQKLYNNINKYKIIPNNLPIFSSSFDNPDDENKKGFKTGSTENSKPAGGMFNYSRTSIKTELQNIQKLKQIQEKRNKYKNLSKVNKEKMDTNNLHKHWSWIVKKEIPKRQKEYQKFKQDVDYNCKRLMLLCQKEAKKKAHKIQKLQKEAANKAKKVQKDMLTNLRKKEKEVNEQKKKDIERMKKQQELEEAVKQKKRLEYLMTQSDIYSFFMSKKTGIDDIINGSKIQKTEKDEGNGETEDVEMDGNTEKSENNDINNNNANYITKKIGDEEVEVKYDENNKLRSLKVKVDQESAMNDVKNILLHQKENISKFDEQCNRLRKKAGGEEIKIDDSHKNITNNDLDMSTNRLDNPFIQNTLDAPPSFKGNLKHYQLKGLNWLDNLFEQGINGILADEMGLGKTIQAIALLAHLSERKNVWGPFLVISPNATLYNWQQEVYKFCPDLKVLPYWGGIEERKLLRKFFNPLNLYTKSSAFHVCITSYQFIVQDQKVFNRVSWQYMILDEAHSIKNVNSIRWNTLLEFSCRNRLLLTGTPIQNSMSELWALLHFIMPNLFDSHEQFQEWFSKDIEAHSQEKGELNEEQLRRLHKILKPFMLRRIKKDVENEIGPKTEYEINCYMTRRQNILYNSIRSKLNNISDLFTSVDSKVKVENLMNLVMQFRKVCNHPELFERHIGKIPHSFKNLFLNGRSGGSGSVTYGTSNSNVNNNYNNINNKDELYQLHTDMRNCISFIIPKIIFDELLSKGITTFKKNNKKKENNFTNQRSLIYSRSNNSNSFSNFFSQFNNNKYTINNSTIETTSSSFLLLKNNKQDFSYYNITDFFKLLPFNENEFGKLLEMDSMISQISLLHFLHRHKIRIDYIKEYLKDLKNNNPKKKRIFKYNPSFVYLMGFISREVFNKDDRLETLYSAKKQLGIESPVFCESISEINHELRSYCEIRKKRLYIPGAYCSPVELSCSSKSFSNFYEEVLYNNHLNRQLLNGLNFSLLQSSSNSLYQRIKRKNNKIKLLSEFSFKKTSKEDLYLIEKLEKGLLSDLFVRTSSIESPTLIELPSFERLIAESSKLKKLDELLDRLKKENHRVLIFCQMTKMIDILEEYMTKRRYIYFRMDGSTNIADRRDMVNEFQSNDNIFAFLLSTRAGGLGVNLTAADTVIFYDNDWNPTMDAQATDRVHRIGQTKPVSVYRLITKHSVEERILIRAKQKQNVQTTVYSGGAFKADVFKQAEIFELLYSEEEVKKIEDERRRIQEEHHLKIQRNKQQLEELEARRLEKKKKREEEKKKKEEERVKKDEEKEIKRINKEQKDKILKEQKEKEQKEKELKESAASNVKKSIFFVSHKKVQKEKENNNDNNDNATNSQEGGVDSQGNEYSENVDASKREDLHEANSIDNENDDNNSNINDNEDEENNLSKDDDNKMILDD